MFYCFLREGHILKEKNDVSAVELLTSEYQE
jgi:hypothetical protein